MIFEQLTCDEKRVHLWTQLEQLGRLETQPRITCICGFTTVIQYMYRCLKCGALFCPKCAVKHFGEGVKMIPRDIKQQIDNYIDEGIVPGDFLQAVLVNDLRSSIIAADDINRYALYDIVVYLENFVPVVSWGSLDQVRFWLIAHSEFRENIQAAIDYDMSRRKEYYDTAQG
jgi:hypothetical protein